MLEPNVQRVLAQSKRLTQPPYAMDADRRNVVLQAIIDRAQARGWTLLAAHVRTTHVHIVIDGQPRPERIMNDLKSYASRALNLAGLDEPDRKRWARHGSTRWLWKEENVLAAIRYVVEEQGEPMTLFQRTAPFGRGSEGLP